MKIAIDLDGTAWEFQGYFKRLMQNMQTQGHEVGILTVHSPDIYEPDIKLLRARGFPDPDFFINKAEPSELSSREWKISQVLRHHIDMLFDDFDTFQPEVYINPYMNRLNLNNPAVGEYVL